MIISASNRSSAANRNNKLNYLLNSSLACGHRFANSEERLKQLLCTASTSTTTATTPLLPEVFEAMRPYLSRAIRQRVVYPPARPAGAGGGGAGARKVADLLDCRPAEIVFTSGGTEGDNLVLFGLMKPGDHVITSAVEHHAVLNACKRLEEVGCAVTICRWMDARWSIRTMCGVRCVRRRSSSA